MIKINLIPEKDVGLKEKFYDDLIFLAIGVGLVFGICMFYGKDLDAEIVKLDTDIVELERTKKNHDLIIQKVKEFEKSKATLEQQLNTINKLKDAKTGPVKMLEEFSLVVPDKVWLEKFNEQATIMEIEGFAFEESAIADFVEHLKLSKYFTNVNLENVDAKSVSNTCDQIQDKTLWFRITGNVSYK